MNTAPIVITLPREELVTALAGLLAEVSIPTLTVALPGLAPTTHASRTTDLPGLLRHAPAGAAITTPAGTVFTLTSDGCSVVNADGRLIEAVGLIGR